MKTKRRSAKPKLGVPSMTELAGRAEERIQKLTSQEYELRSEIRRLQEREKRQNRLLERVRNELEMFLAVAKTVNAWRDANPILPVANLTETL